MGNDLISLLTIENRILKLSCFLAGEARRRFPYNAVIIVFLAVIFFCCGLKSTNAQTHISQIKDKETIDLLTDVPASGIRVPKANAFILLLDQKHIIKANGTLISKKHVMIKVLTEAGRAAGDVVIPFNSYFDKLKVNIARTINPNGDIQDVAKDAILEESSFADFPVFSDFKVKKIIFPGVKIGSVIEYEIETIENNKFIPGFSFVFTIPVKWIVWRARFSVDVPNSMPVKYKAEKFLNAFPLITAGNKSKIYTWQEDYLHVKGGDEPSAANYMKIGPYVAFSAIEDWHKINDWGLNLARNQFNPDKTVEQQANALIKGRKQDKKGLIEPVFNFVSRNIRYVAIELGEASFKPYPAAEVLKNAYGDCKGKSALLVAMLKSIGIPAYPALLVTNNSGFILEDIPMVNFNHMIVAVPDGEGYLFLDPTAEMLTFDRLPFFEQGCDVFIIKKDKKKDFVKIPVDPANDNKINRQCRLVLNSDSQAEVKENYTYTGQIDWPNRVLVKNTPPGKYKKLFEEIARSVFVSFKLNDSSISDYNNFKIPFSLESNFTVDNYARKSGNLYRFAVPATEPLVYNVFSKMPRQTPLDLGFAFVKEEDILITIPAGYKVKSLPDPLVLDNPLASYKKEIREAGGKISVYTKWVLKTKEISIGKYGVFKNMVDKIRKSNREDVILEEGA